MASRWWEVSKQCSEWSWDSIFVSRRWSCAYCFDLNRVCPRSFHTCFAVTLVVAAKIVSHTRIRYRQHIHLSGTEQWLCQIYPTTVLTWRILSWSHHWPIRNLSSRRSPLFLLTKYKKHVFSFQDNVGTRMSSQPVFAAAWWDDGSGNDDKQNSLTSNCTSVTTWSDT